MQPAWTPLIKGESTMLAILILFLAALSRLIPHEFHGVAYNFTAVGAGLLFFGSRRPRWQAVLAVAVMGLMDVYLTTQVYHYPFHVRGYLVTWAWYAAVCLMGSALLRKVTALRVVAGVLATSTSFFLLSNFMVWLGSRMYPHTAAGLGACYAAGLPFYGNDLMSTALFAGVFFGLPALAARWSESGASAQPLA
jgi:hypothetical protein